MSNKQQTLRFDQMAKHSSTKVKNPQDADVDVYVGLEHLDPESLIIKRHGSPDDVKATKLLVKPGQIIFGKRRAYQRKVAVADFHGICSAHAMVLDADPETMAPGFLPFFMQSDIFFERAIAISEGSLSPTIKWKTLARQEFKVPAIEKQKELVKLFQGLETAIQTTEAAIEKAEILKQSLMKELLTRGIGHTRFKQTKLGEIPESWGVFTLDSILLKITAGKSILCTNKSADANQYGVLKVSAVSSDKFKPEENKVLPDNFIVREEHLVRPGDVLITRANTKELVGAVCQVPENVKQNLMLSDKTLRLEPDKNKITSEFLNLLLQTNESKSFLSKNATGTSGSMKNISQKKIIRLLLQMPDKEEQKIITSILKRCKDNTQKMSFHLNSHLSLKKSLLDNLIL